MSSKLHCPRCGSLASIDLGYHFPDDSAEIEPLGIVVEIEIAALAYCTASCGQPMLEMPVNVGRYATSGWLPPVAFNDESKAWYEKEIA